MPKGAVITITFVAWCAFMGVWFIMWQISERLPSFQDPCQWDDDYGMDTYCYGDDDDEEDMSDFVM